MGDFSGGPLSDVGLLEQDLLWLGRPSSRPRPLHSAGGELVGVARRVRGGRWSLWPTLEVREAEDEPLLLTVRRAWSLWPRWDVLDAEGERVGVLAGDRVLDRWDRPLAWRFASGRGGAFQSGQGAVVAWWADENEGVKLVFRPAVQGDPFFKMLLLAAVLRG